MKPSITIPGKSPIVCSLCEPEFHGHFRPHSNQDMIYHIIAQPMTQISPWTVTGCPLESLTFFHLCSKLWNRSNGHSRPHCGTTPRRSGPGSGALTKKIYCGTPASAADPTYSDFWWTPGLGRPPYPLRDLPHFHGSPRTWDLGLKHQILTKWVPTELLAQLVPTS